jgi:hypothetical protein
MGQGLHDVECDQRPAGGDRIANSRTAAAIRMKAA